MMRGLAPLSKTVHGIPVSTRGTTVPSTPKDQTGEFPIQRPKAWQRTELTPLPSPTIPQQLQHPQPTQMTTHLSRQVFLKEQEPRQAIWQLIKDSPATREQQPNQQGQVEEMQTAEEEEDQEAKANHPP